MSFWHNLDDGAKSLFALLTKSSAVSSRMDPTSTVTAIMDATKNPKAALTDGSAQTILYTVDDLLAMGAIIPSPATPALAVAATALGAIAEEEPVIALGAEFLLATQVMKIPAVTEATEEHIEDQLGTTHGRDDKD